MKVEIHEGKETIIDTQQMRFGQVGVAVGHGYAKDNVILRYSGGFINLSAGQQFLGGNTSILVRLLPPGTEIKLTVEV